MEIRYQSQNYKATQLLTLIIALLLPQFLSLGKGIWWLFFIITFAIAKLHRQPEIYGYPGLGQAIIAAQIANVVGGISFYFFEDHRSIIILAVWVFNSLYPIPKMIMTSQQIIKREKLGPKEN